ncbi:MAG: glycoside hydrolase family 25 protein [Actinomycetota bacterium]|nr:glycoside hydrolase family 25 protein [Actinomycetota bacterium]
MVLTALAGLACLAPAATAKNVRGIDVSRFQDVIGWKLVGETKLRFAFVAASRGSGEDCLVVPDRCGADEFFARNYRGAKAAGLRVGAYHRGFASGSTPEAAKADARAEANLFISQVGKVRNRDLRPALDVETPFVDMTKASLRAWIGAWLTRVEKKLGAEPIIYTNFSSWGATGDTTSFALEGHPLWVANFDVPEPLVPADDWAGRGWSVWQYTSSGSVRGIDGAVDKNRLSAGFSAISAG